MKIDVRRVCAVALVGLAFVCEACGAEDAEGQEVVVAGDDGEDMVVQASAVTSAKAPRRTPTPAIVRSLQKATNGLLFLSESDYPFDVLYWRNPGGSPSAARIAALMGEDATVVEERSIDAFFNGAATPQDWHSPEDLATVRRYQELVTLLKSKLRKLTVYRFGTIQIHAYVVGVTSAGNWVALKTTQIET